MALEDTATAGATDQPQESVSAAGDTASATPSAEQTQAQDQPTEGADEPVSEEARAELERAGEVLTKLPPALRKEYQRAITQAFQRAAEKGKRYEPYSELIQSLETDPVNTIKALAERANIIQKPEPGTKATDSVLTELANVVGEDEAQRLAPILKAVAKQAIEEEVKPLRQHQEYVTAEFAREQTAQVMKAFSEKHPEWEKHEPKMLEIAKGLQPNGMDEGTYLETLWKLATYDIKSAEQTKRIVEKMGQSAAASESVASGVNASRVSPTPRAFKDSEEAFAAAVAAARKGEVWG